MYHPEGENLVEYFVGEHQQQQHVLYLDLWAQNWTIQIHERLGQLPTTKDILRQIQRLHLVDLAFLKCCQREIDRNRSKME